MESQTHISLLERLAQPGAPDQAAWVEFARHYGGKINGWCLRWGLQESDAADVTQSVLLKLSQRMKTFAYEPGRSFRGWLRTVTRSALCDFDSDRQRHGRGTGGSAILEQFLSVEARADLEQRIEDEYDRELLEHAITRVRLRVAPHTWDAFRMTAMEGQPAAEVASRLHMTVANVYKARSAVLEKLQEERRQLETARENTTS